MSDFIAIEQAARRLSLALDALEAAVERRREMDGNEESLTVQLHQLGTDRSRLAADLDRAFARHRALETTNREIARRLDIAMDAIRAVLEAHGQ
jgi:hypothetical protein